MNNTKKNRSGATIIEVVASLVMLAAFLAGTSKFILIQQQISDKSRAHYTAINIAKNQIEQVRTVVEKIGYDQIYAQIEPGAQVAANGEGDSNGRFIRVTEVNRINNFLSEVVVTVKILDRISMTWGDEQEILKTYISRPER